MRTMKITQQEADTIHAALIYWQDALHTGAKPPKDSRRIAKRRGALNIDQVADLCTRVASAEFQVPLPKLIHLLAEVDDLDAVVANLQEFLGVYDGGVAAIFFHRKRAAWAQLGPDMRSVLMIQYISSELAWGTIRGKRRN